MGTETDREAIHEAIAANSGHAQDATGGAVLTGWLTVAEWMDKDGTRYLSHCRAASTTPWGARGMMHEVLYGDWPDGEA